MRQAVIGDVGGHLAPLQDELTRLGVNVADAAIPEDLTVVQLGDLVHRGPDSVGVLCLIDRLMAHNPGRWLQLVGNHESLYLRKPSFIWKERLDDEWGDLLRGWWADGLMRIAAVVPTAAGDMLVTHAGVTEQFWTRDLGAPATAHETAEALNRAEKRKELEAVFRPGLMLNGDVNPRVGPIWAEAGSELVVSWLDTSLPFGQVHGHTSMVDWSTGAWQAIDEIRERTLFDLVACHETTILDGGTIVGIDPGHTVAPQSRWHAWEPTQAD